ncbi:MAG TPA: cupin domain-containing protein [Holophagaceae bacterium]|nr:cupin domain-containing protein [Holophagaceae bacterium]
MINLPITSLETLLPILPGGRNVMPLLDLAGEAKVVLAALDAGVVVPPHPMPREATLLLLSGAIDFLIEDTWQSLRPGEFLRVPGQASHSVRALAPSRFIVLQAQATRA